MSEEVQSKTTKKVPSFVTPEFIEKQRKKKLERLAKRAAKGVPPPPTQRPFNDDFIKRPMLRLPSFQPFEKDKQPLTFTVMSYNVLAQTNIRRTMFPKSGDALKWKFRSRMLENELLHYMPTVGCMQEVDAEFVPSFYQKVLEEHGYKVHFVRYPGKTHGIFVFWSAKVFTKVNDVTISYDEHDELPGRMPTKNVGCCVALQRIDQPDRGIYLATTHLFWHPFGSYERLRQGALLVKEVNKFAQSHPWPVFIAGDFNTEPYDTNFPALTTRPLDISKRSMDIIERSMSYVFGAADLDEKNAEEKASGLSIESAVPEQESVDVETGPDDETSTEATQESTSSASVVTLETQVSKVKKKSKKIRHVQSSDFPHYDIFFDQHAKNPVVKSLYSYGYKKVHPGNAGNTFEHPSFTNWADKYRGHLDYIFVMDRNAVSAPKTEEVNDSGRITDDVRLVSLLRCPENNEMNEAEPQEGRFPSDHVAIMAEVQVL
ncbi:CCR4/nocturin family endoribonuclease [Schizosaccharomyces japonicus yFS275]|uniref:CCR4/nocturin family endoribonuclease n=1 Tax=Schizosaccharomyces japonicus (strain yFS275 / FY16936) TaxID=402676 RepID=B6K716_SCHJY|nr:CCR4/nocturin family endoribonuclease [Schizosaccharomyces japonicus yFS275]EEB09320.1 CCR4/nocturin family endoribonuclease [Schizosaccharomyces japonicus yFS275]